MNSSSISRPDARDAKLRTEGSTHTPAPWMAAAGPSSVVGWPVVARPSGRSICNVSWLPGLPAEVEAEVRANAALIAAAPDLLKLAQDAWGALNFILAFYEPGQRHLDTNAWKNAEARGRYVHAALRAKLDTLPEPPQDQRVASDQSREAP